MNRKANIIDIVSALPQPQPTGRCACGAQTYFRRPECEPCAEKRETDRRRRKLWADACPARYRDARFDSATLCDRVRDPRALDAVDGVLSRYRVVVLLGPSGVGKTTLGAALAAQWAESQGRHGCFASAMALATARADSRLGETPAIVRDAIRAGVTLLDDLGNEPIATTSSVVETIFARHDADAHMVVTSGLNRRAIADRYGGGAARRLLESTFVVDMSFPEAKR